MKKILLTCAIALNGWLVLAQASSKQDSIEQHTLSFKEAKARLLKKNLQLLASYYDINIARAGVIQARLWNNPYFVFNGDLYSNEANEYFHFRNQHLLQVEQTFSYAGKHTNTVKLAKLGVDIAEKQLEDILRSLIFETGNLYNDLAALQQKGLLYQQVMKGYDRLMESTRKQLEVGAISVTEALRLESEYLAVKTEALTNQSETERVMSDLRTLLRMPADTSFLVEQRTPLIGDSFDINALIQQALSSRPDIQVTKYNLKYQERNLKLQRSIGVPDLKLAYQPRDRGSNYVRPYQGFNVEFNIPLFDRNQGEVKAAEYQIRKSQLEIEQIENQAKNQITAAYNRYQNSKAGLANYSDQLLEKLKQLNTSTNENFQKRNISLLQFIDYQRIYILTNTQLIELKQQFINNVNELNFVIGTSIIDY